MTRRKQQQKASLRGVHHGSKSCRKLATTDANRYIFFKCTFTPTNRHLRESGESTYEGKKPTTVPPPDKFRKERHLLSVSALIRTTGQNRYDSAQAQKPNKRRVLGHCDATFTWKAALKTVSYHDCETGKKETRLRISEWCYIRQDWLQDSGISHAGCLIITA